MRMELDSLSILPVDATVIFVKNPPGIQANDPINLTRFCCQAFPLDYLDIASPTYELLQRETITIASDTDLQTAIASLHQDAHDPDLLRHFKRVGHLFAHGLARLINDESALRLSVVGELHDVGKIMDQGIHHLTQTPNKLTDGEYAVTKKHVLLPSSLLQQKYPMILKVIIGHHEFGQKNTYRRVSIHLDEAGYQLLIPLRIWLSLCDKADAMISLRPDEGSVVMEVLPKNLLDCGYSEKLVETLMLALPKTNQLYPFMV